MDAGEIANSLSAEERRELRRSAKRHWRWPWQRKWYERMRVPAGSVEKMREMGLYKATPGGANKITRRGRSVAALLEK
jgi:hypothetical protein